MLLLANLFMPPHPIALEESSTCHHHYPQHDMLALHQYPAMALQPLAILIREQNAQGHCFFLVLLARTHRLACTNSLTSYLIYSPKMSKSSLKTGPQQEQEHGRKEEDYQGRKGGIDVSSPSGTACGVRGRGRHRRSVRIWSCRTRLASGMTFCATHITLLTVCMISSKYLRSVVLVMLAAADLQVLVVSPTTVPFAFVHGIA